VYTHLSRRLGRSLGVDVVPLKTCNYSCVYCELGETTNKINERLSFFPKRDILNDVMRVLDGGMEIDHITFAGDGEPALCKDLGWLIEKIKEITDIPVVVITNGSLLGREDVREDLANADIVIPSLDAADVETFRQINRPCRGLEIDEIVDGLVDFRKSYRGTLYVEVMLVKNFNDSVKALQKIRDAIRRIKPDGVYVLTPVRPTATPVEPADWEAISKACKIIGSVAR
jgi:wyosine [tRNA(Phe)-imidazoG37] synthetase (radical SAM superfamily)